MTLKDRLQYAERTGPITTVGVGASPGEMAPSSSRTPPPDPVAGLRRRAQEALFARLGSRLYDVSVSPEQLRTMVVQELNQTFAESELPLTEDERHRLVTQVTEDVLGYGPIQEYLEDPDITEVMVNSTESIYVERDGKVIETGKRFASAEHLRRMIERIVAQVGRRIDESSPMVDARLPDGSRVNAVIPPLSVDGPILTVRKFSRRVLSADDLIAVGTMTPRLAAFLDVCVRAKVSTIVSGGTGSGKTTLLNTLSGFLPEPERIVTIEDAVELQLQQRHRIRLESRPPNIEGKGMVTIRDLVRNALRMRPDRIIVGEVRGAEALDMLQAMNTGHEGSLTTLHANSPRDALARLETMILMAGMDLPLAAIREQIASAIDLVVHIDRLPDGTRRIVQVADVAGIEGNTIQLDDLFVFDFEAGVDDLNRHRGMIQPTGLRPSFEAKLRRAGLELTADTFWSDQAGTRRNGGGR